MADLFTPELTPEIRAAVIAELRTGAAGFAAQGRNAIAGGICSTMWRSGHSHPEPIGLYEEPETLKTVEAVFRRMLDAAEGIELYQPSNGTEGECFMGQWCDRCVRETAYRADPGRADGCEIIAQTMVSDIDDPDYPREWRQDGPKGPRCTAFEPEPGQ